LSNKRSVHDSLQAYFLGHDIQNVFVPDTLPGWLDRLNWESGPLPNLVSKLPGADHGIGVAFYKARNKEHALELAGQKLGSEFLFGGLLGKLERRTRPEERHLQAFVASSQFADGRLANFRANVLITPVGSKLLSVTKFLALQKIPDSLPYGVVADPRPYLVNGGVGASRHLPEPSEVAALEPVADILAAAMIDRLERHFAITKNE